MKRLALSLAMLAACAGFQAQADNPPPGLLAKIQIAPQAHLNARGEFKDIKKFVRENAAHNVQTKKVGTLDVAKFNHDRAHTGAIGKGIGGQANDGDKD